MNRGSWLCLGGRVQSCNWAFDWNSLTLLASSSCRGFFTLSTFLSLSWSLVTLSWFGPLAFHHLSSQLLIHSLLNCNCFAFTCSLTGSAIASAIASAFVTPRRSMDTHTKMDTRGWKQGRKQAQGYKGPNGKSTATATTARSKSDALLDAQCTDTRIQVKKWKRNEWKMR